MSRSARWPLALSGIVLLSQAFPLPSPVRDAATLQWAAGFRLQIPLTYAVFAPFCGLADMLTVLSLKQAAVFLAYLLAAGWVGSGWRSPNVRRPVARRFGDRRFWIFLVGVVGFLAWGALAPRPMARLIADDPDILLIDFHSHTRVSHDGRKSFTPEANMRWHKEQGYNAAFITDHNRVEASRQAKMISRADWRQTGYRSLEGEEVSLYKTHLVILGNHQRVDNGPYDSDPSRIAAFIADMHRQGLPVIASLPEYWLYHWGPSEAVKKIVSSPRQAVGRAPASTGNGWGPPRASSRPGLPGRRIFHTFSPPPSHHQGRGIKGEGLGTVQDFIRWGIDGFEIVNSAPKALDFPLGDRLQVVRLCRDKNLFMTGISDNHGYGYATAAWNAMLLPGWRALDPDQLETAILERLARLRFSAVTVLERAHYNPATTTHLIFSPPAQLYYYWRSLQPLQALSWALWIWTWPAIRLLKNELQRLVSF